MALSPKLKKDQVPEKTIEELILKGGSSGERTSETNEHSEDSIKRVQLRLPTQILEKIDALIKERPGRVSRHTWIMEAIAEKLSNR